MNYVKKIIILIIALTLHPGTVLNGRSTHRPVNKQIPTLLFSYADSNKNGSNQYNITNAHLTEYPWFGTFEKIYTKQYEIPKNEQIPFRNYPEKTVSSDLLIDHIKTLLEQVQEKKRYFTNFTVIQKKDFNRKQGYGLIVVKHKQYPFIVKLFIETPESMTRYWSKGFEPIFFFYMGGGINRHLSGFTRIKNHAQIQKKIKNDPYWSTRVDVPKKWYWTPKDSHWISITGNNIGNKKTQSIKIPGVYALIAEEIQFDEKFSLRNKEQKREALAICNFLDIQIDPHIKNFLKEKKTGKILIIDTEHFPSMVGLTEKINFHSYKHWYYTLIKKCSMDMVFCTKADLKNKQAHSMVYFPTPSA